MILLPFVIFTLILPFYFSNKFKLLKFRIFIFSIIPVLLFTVFAVIVLILNENTVRKEILNILFFFPFVMYALMYPALILTSTLMIYLEKYYFFSSKIFILQGVFITYLSLSLYMIIVVESFDAPFRGWHYPTSASFLLLFSIMIYNSLKKNEIFIKENT
ncbi:hypothetical protein MNB_SV-13-1411 [hydrothermal vent metagenome]|uniref:Uncharacterized protein n=1 Tax=hydrothermal vent metagenome TaxID=652676 RepID=A0A1W1D0J5_9ZZZZ